MLKKNPFQKDFCSVRVSQSTYPLRLAPLSPTKSQIYAYNIWGGCAAHILIYSQTRGDKADPVADWWHFMPRKCPLTPRAQLFFNFLFFNKGSSLHESEAKLEAGRASRHVQRVTADYISASSFHIFSPTPDASQYTASTGAGTQREATAAEIINLLPF